MAYSLCSTFSPNCPYELSPNPKTLPSAIITQCFYPQEICEIALSKGAKLGPAASLWKRRVVMGFPQK
jgi:hypothetical protein